MNILCKYEQKLRGFFNSFAFLEKTCFVCNSMGKGPVEGAINLYFKAFKGLLLKKPTLLFSDFFAKMLRYDS